VEIIYRDGKFLIRRPTTARGWATSSVYVLRWMLTSARLPHPSLRRHYARVSLLLTALSGTVIVIAFFLLYLAVE
jgi:hypothetical protein